MHARYHEPSTSPHPVDAMEPIDEQGSEYRQCARKMLGLLDAVFYFSMSSKCPRTATLQWAKAMGLSAVRDQSVTQIAASLGLTKQDVSKGITKFLAISQLPPALDLKSDRAKLTYRVPKKCKPKP